MLKTAISSPLRRRRMLQLGMGLGVSSIISWPQETASLTLTAVDGIKVGHWTHESGSTGCTVILTERGAVAGVDVRGGGPGTRETDLLKPESSVQQVHAVVLSGGSAYGLSTADGVMHYLESEGLGFKVGRNIVPIVPAAILYDLGIGDPAIRPDAESGLLAVKNCSNQAVSMGNVGAGAGATVGKMLGPKRAMRGGLGSAAIRFADGLAIGALAAVNALGDIVDPATGQIIAGARSEDGKDFADSMQLLRKAVPGTKPNPTGNTTLGVIAANVDWTKSQATKVAQMAQDGLALAIRPAHMPFDGDTTFALGSGGRRVDQQLLGVIGALAVDLMAQAILAGIQAARSGFGLLSAADIRK